MNCKLFSILLPHLKRERWTIEQGKHPAQNLYKVSEVGGYFEAM